MSIWDEGEYELTAGKLVPAAEVAVAELAPEAGARVLDLGCGTGNAAALAAAAGARVVGVDTAQRLLEVARARVPSAEFVAGDAVRLPFDDDAFDAAVSVFGVIFADPPAAARELLRVVRPGGRIVVTAWVPEGPMSEMGAIIARALGREPEPPRWSDPAVVRELFGPHDVAIGERTIPFLAASPRAYVDEQASHQPMWLAAGRALREAGRYDDAMDEIHEVFAAANEDPAAFRVTSRYYLVTVSA